MADRNHRVFIGDSRDMSVLEDSSVDLVVTSPPYWHIKDYGTDDQIGYGQDLHTYLKDLFLVWKECTRVTKTGRRICINIGDQFAKSTIYGRYKVIPLHAEIISQMELLGTDYMGSIIWNKKTTMNTSGGAVVMGSYPYPPNGIVEIDYEYIMIFKKPGKTRKVDRDLKEGSRMTKEEWKQFHSGHWYFGGARQVSHEAMFPIELPSRLIRMFTFKGDTVLDPFLGSGTTMEAASVLERRSVGFEIKEDFISIIKDRLPLEPMVEKVKRPSFSHNILYFPSITNAAVPSAGEKKKELKRVRSIDKDLLLVLDDGSITGFAGLIVKDRDGARTYLEKYVKGREVSIDEPDEVDGGLIFLKNRIYVNGELLKRGYADITDQEFKGRLRLKRILERSVNKN